MSEWKVTYMSDYPYSDNKIIEADSEASAKKKFKEIMGFWDEYCSIIKQN